MKDIMLTFAQIEKMVDTINQDLGIDKNQLPSYGSDYGNRPNYVVINKDGYSLIAFGHYRDKDHDRLIVKTLDIDELLFEIFRDATFMIAMKYELENRIPDQDCRIIGFQKHLEILKSLKLNDKYFIRLRDYYDYLLKLEKPLSPETPFYVRN
jgi:hypothetical protein